MPVLERVLSETGSLEVKRRAIYVLALSEDARARPILLHYARGEGAPALQAEAIRFLVSRRDPQTSSHDLHEIYETTTDVRVRLEIVDALDRVEFAGHLVAMARDESDGPLKSAIIAVLSDLAPRSPEASAYLAELER